jgi:hypothetical protein
MAAMSATSALWESEPKSTMVKMVCATAGEIAETTNNPTKLHMAAIKIACFGLIERVETAVAIAFGASVAPFTMITPMLSSVITAINGLLVSCDINKERSIVMKTFSLCSVAFLHGQF